MIRTTPELFAMRGDQWNARNPQFSACNKGYVSRLHPDGTRERVFKDDVEGYDAPKNGPRAAIRKREFVEPNPGLKVDLGEARRRCIEARTRNKIRKALGAPETIHVR